MEGNRLCYYVDTDKKDLRGRYDLNATSSVHVSSHSGHEICFELVAEEVHGDNTWTGTPGRLTMQAENEQERTRWMEAINAAISTWKSQPKYHGRCFCGDIEYEIAGKYAWIYC